MKCFFKKNEATDNGQDNSKEVLKKEFLADMSYRIRNPLNSICGIVEIAEKNIRNQCDKDQLIGYMEILRESVNELQEIVDEGFDRYEAKSINGAITEKDAKGIDDYSILKNLRILLVEDNTVNQVIVKELLEDQGAIISVCSDGESAVTKFRESITGTYDIIFMDIKMPGMDGYAATDEIRRTNHPQAKTIPIIAMTAEVFPESIQMALKAGMNAHIGKPISLARVVAAIKSVK